MRYDLFEHRHRFSAWAAARAAQVRSGMKVADMREALECCGLPEFLREPQSKHMTREKFEALHRRWCAAIMECLEQKGVRQIAYGRAAKLVAVYLKAMVVLGPDPDCELARVAHPPIDGIMLDNLCSSKEVKSPHKDRWGDVKWTQLNAEEYYQLASELFACLESDEPLWHLEKYWTVTRN